MRTNNDFDSEAEFRRQLLCRMHPIDVNVLFMGRAEAA